jgi:hypothetical protein
LTRGRSRDVHAWEFACDADNREDALTEHAKHESNGSAIAAISLLRSTSSTGCTSSPLQPSSSAKRNAAATKAPARSGMAKKPKLGRASSSVGRLQTTGDDDRDGAEAMAPEPAPTGRDKVKVSMLLSPCGNESDKENWSPDEDGNPHHNRHSHHRLVLLQDQSPVRRTLPPCSSLPQPTNSRRTLGRVLHDHASTSGPSFLTSASRTPGKHSQLDIFEDSPSRGPLPPPRAPDEVERFMRGEVSPSKKGDVVAVAGLLSLSQGNWR